MTLVIGRFTDRGLTLHGDIQLTQPDAAHGHDLFGGELKVVTTHPRIAFGLAGSQALARQLIRDTAGKDDTDEVLQFARRATGTGALEVLVSTLQPDRLFRCRGSSVEVYAEGQSWVGDQAAFAGYQGIAAQLRGQHDFDVSSLAIRQLVRDRLFSGVGGLVVSLLTDTDGFEYSAAIEAHAGTMSPQSIPSHQWSAIRFGQGPAAGAFTCAICTPAQPGIGAVGIYVYEAGCGAIYWPATFDEPRVVAAATQQEFEKSVSAVLGCQVAAPFLS
ncbi:MAG: hypothetical protein KGZ72_05465 [Roseovarius sp.]|jgi:hypothetical protein|nr:hypothetical protein [Roseovarius sp.]